MPRVTIVQHQGSVPPGLILEVLEEAGMESAVVRAWTDDPWPAIDEIAALVVMGGTMNVDELDTYPFLARSRATMAAALERDLPTLGVCLGSQMMARVLGAEVHRASARNAFFAPVEVTDEGRGDPVVEPFAAGVPVLQFHEDTFEIPPETVPLATSATSGTQQAFRYGERAYAIQFHFEVDRHIVSGWLEDIGPESMERDWGTVSAALLRDADRYLNAQRHAGRELTTRFLKVAGL